MKRLLIGFAACTLIMASCSQNEVFENVSEGQGQLSFSTGLGKQAVTRAAELNNTALQEVTEINGIVLNAYQNVNSTWSRWYEDEVVYKDGDWKLQNSVRFRNTNATMYITYFSEKGLVASPTDFDDADFDAINPTGTFPKFTYTVAANSMAQEDLIAGITNVPANKQDIVLAMRHILSQVNFGTVGYKGAQIMISDIQIVGLKNNATYTFRADENGTAPDFIGSWSDQKGTATYPYYAYGNTLINSNPQPSVPTDKGNVMNVNRGDIYVFGDGGNWGPGKGANTFYPVVNSGAWNNSSTNPQSGLANSLMLMPQDFVDTGAKVTFKYHIVDKDGGDVFGTPTAPLQGEFKLDFTTGTTSGKDYRAKWEQNFRYLYLIDFTDLLDGVALTFKVDVQMYPWENYNKDQDDNGIVDITVIGQLPENKANTLTDANSWYIATQSATAPTVAQKAQLVSDGVWRMDAYDFTLLGTGDKVVLNFQNVIFNGKEISLTLPAGYTASVTGDLAINGSGTVGTPYIIKTTNTGILTATSSIIITNANQYKTTAALKIGIDAATTDGTAFAYKATTAVDLTTMIPVGLADTETITVQFYGTVVPTVGVTTYGSWTWNGSSKVATFTRNDVLTLEAAKTAFKNVTTNGQTIKCGDAIVIEMGTTFEQPDDINVTSVTVAFSKAAARTFATSTTDGTWTNPSNDNKTYVWTKN